MSDRSIRRRLADQLIRLGGDDARTDELHGHLDEASRNGQDVDVADLTSLGSLAVRTTGNRMAKDLPWWLAGLPVALLLLMPLALSYETQFFAWDVVEREPASSSARAWKTSMNVLLVGSVVAGVFAGRRVIEHLRHGRVAGPAGLILVVVGAATQADLFVERSPWFREGRLKEAHVDEVPMYGVALFTAFALIPVAFLLFDYFTGPRSSREISDPAIQAQSGERLALDGRAIAAVAMPFLLFAIGAMWVLPFVVLLWSAPSFSPSLKAAATAAVGLPLAGLIAWTVAVGDIDDGSSLLLVMVFVQLIIWIRMAFVALRPLRALDVQFSLDDARL